MIIPDLLKYSIVQQKNHYHAMIFFGIIFEHGCVFELQKRVDSQMQNFLNSQFFLHPLYYSCYVIDHVLGFSKFLLKNANSSWFNYSLVNFYSKLFKNSKTKIYR